VITVLLFVVVLVLLLGDLALAHAKAAVFFRRAYDCLLLIVFLVGGAVVGRKAWQTMRQPPAWDVQSYWLWGRAAALGLNPYLPASMRAIALPGPLPPDFAPEVFDVGFVYPPLSLLLFAPMGTLPLRSATVVWVGVQLVCLVLCVVLLWRMFLPDRGLRGLELVAALTLLLPATGVTFALGQTNFLALLLVLATWRVRDQPVSALYILAASVVKPLYNILWLYPLLRGRWRTLLLGAIGTAALSAVVIGIFGFDTFATYFRDNPVKRLPFHVLIEPANTSIHALMLRHQSGALVHGIPTSGLEFDVAAAVVLLITVWASVRASRTAEGEGRGSELAMAVLLPAGLLLYPGTLAHYTVVLLAPLVWLWSRHGAMTIRGAWIAVLIALVYAITHYDAGHDAIVATAAVWITLVALAAWPEPALIAIPTTGRYGSATTSAIANPS
jgi:glycosyl transferase family 87